MSSFWQGGEEQLPDAWDWNRNPVVFLSRLWTSPAILTPFLPTLAEIPGGTRARAFGSRALQVSEQGCFLKHQFRCVAFSGILRSVTTAICFLKFPSFIALFSRGNSSQSCWKFLLICTFLFLSNSYIDILWLIHFTLLLTSSHGGWRFNFSLQ